MKLCTLVSIAVALVAAQPALSEEHLRGVASADGPDGPDPRGKKGEETCGCYDLDKHKCSCKDSVCSKGGCQNRDKERYFWTGGCTSCHCDDMVVGTDCPEKPPHLEDAEADVERADAAVVASAPVVIQLEEHLRGVVGVDGPDGPNPRGKKGEETCGCYDLDKHKCSCKDSVCSKGGCQNRDKERYFWTGGCTSCHCDDMVVGTDCPEKPPHLEDAEADVERADAAVVASA